MRTMKTSLLAPLFAALVFTGAARSENPDQPRHDGAPSDAPSPERLRRRLEELHRDGKHEEAERLQRHAREMWEQHRGDFQSKDREEAHDGRPSGSPGEREAHLAEAAKHLHAAGINVSPEMLEHLGHRAPGMHGHRSPGEHAERAGGPPPFAPKGGPAPGADAPLEAMHNEIRALARQVQELRAAVPRQHGGEPNRADHDGNTRRPEGGEQHRERGVAPGAAPERHEAPARTEGDRHDSRPRDARPPNAPGNPPPHEDRPQGEAPVPPPAR